MLENGARRIAIEIDDEASHNKSIIADNKFYDHLLKQNSMVHLGWDIYRFAVRQMQQQPDTIQDELRIFLGSHPQFKEIEDYLPTQRGLSIDAVNLELKDYRPGALALGSQAQKTAEEGLYAKGERPDAIIDWPVDVTDYELVGVFNWQEEAAGMISQMEFVRRVDVQTETIERYVREGLLLPETWWCL